MGKSLAEIAEIYKDRSVIIRSIEPYHVKAIPKTVWRSVSEDVWNLLRKELWFPVTRYCHYMLP